MRYPLAIAFAICTTCWAADVPAKPMSVEYASKEGKYTVTFPGKPKQTSSKVTVMGAESDISVVQETVEIDGVAFVVAYNDYPNGLLDPKPQKVLEGVRTGNIGDKGKLIDETIGKFGPDKLPMREFTYSHEKLFMRNRIILDGDRLYQIMVLAPDEKTLTSAAADKLYDSFILERKAK